MRAHTRTMTTPIARRRLLAVGGASTAGAAFLAACSGSSKNDTPGSSSGVREATIIAGTAAAATQGTPKPGGTLNLATTGNAPLDPYANATFLALTLTGFMSGRLLKFKTDPDPAVSSRFEI